MKYETGFLALQPQYPEMLSHVLLIGSGLFSPIIIFIDFNISHLKAKVNNNHSIVNKHHTADSTIFVLV
jgi:hypothetical protein